MLTVIPYDTETHNMEVYDHDNFKTTFDMTRDFKQDLKTSWEQSHK